MEEMNASVVALSGFKRSGKDALADFLVSKALERREQYGIEKAVKTAFADPFRKMTGLVLDIDESSVEDKEAPIPYTRRYFGKDLSWREILIRLGEGMKNVVCPNVWALSMENRLYNGAKSSSGYFAVIPDVRYAQELKLLQKLRKKGFRVFYYGVFRKSALPDWWKLGITPNTKEERAILEKDFGADHSEWEILQKNPKLDGAVYNDGTLEDLEADAEHILSKVYSDANANMIYEWRP